MAQFYTFPCSCAVQVLGGFGDGGEMPKESLDLKHRLTVAVTQASRQEHDGALVKLGFKKLGDFNAAHTAGSRLCFWVAGGEFKLTEDSDGSSKESSTENSGN